LLGVLAGGALEVIHLRSQVSALQREQSSLKSVADAEHLDHASIAGLATDLADLRADVRGDERGFSLRTATSSSALDARVSELSQAFTNYCKSLDFHLPVEVRLAPEAYCPLVAP
jgi:hypothetical protein